MEKQIITKGLEYIIDPKSVNQKSLEISGEPITKKEANSKFKDINYMLFGVVMVLLIMVATLIIDSFHFNSATYKEYSQKTESVETIQKTNENLLKQVQELSGQNNQNQELIIKQQNQLLESLNKR